MNKTATWKEHQPVNELQSGLGGDANLATLQTQHLNRYFSFVEVGHDLVEYFLRFPITKRSDSTLLITNSGVPALPVAVIKRAESLFVLYPLSDCLGIALRDRPSKVHGRSPAVALNDHDLVDLRFEFLNFINRVRSRHPLVSVCESFEICFNNFGRIDRCLLSQL